MELARSKILTTSCKKGEGGSSRPKIREEAGLQKIFSALRASVWSKTMGGRGGPLLDPPLKPMCDPPRDFRE